MLHLQAGIKELSAKHASGEALSMEASRKLSRTPAHLPLCSDVLVPQKTRMSHSWDTHHNGNDYLQFSSLISDVVD